MPRTHETLLAGYNTPISVARGPCGYAIATARDVGVPGDDGPPRAEIRLVQYTRQGVPLDADQRVTVSGGREGVVAAGQCVLRWDGQRYVFAWLSADAHYTAGRGGVTGYRFNRPTVVFARFGDDGASAALVSPARQPGEPGGPLQPRLDVDGLVWGTDGYSLRWRDNEGDQVHVRLDREGRARATTVTHIDPRQRRREEWLSQAGNTRLLRAPRGLGISGEFSTYVSIGWAAVTPQVTFGEVGADGRWTEGSSIEPAAGPRLETARWRVDHYEVAGAVWSRDGAEEPQLRPWFMEVSSDGRLLREHRGEAAIVEGDDGPSFSVQWRPSGPVWFWREATAPPSPTADHGPGRLHWAHIDTPVSRVGVLDEGEEEHFLGHPLATLVEQTEPRNDFWVVVPLHGRTRSDNVGVPSRGLALVHVAPRGGASHRVEVRRVLSGGEAVSIEHAMDEGGEVSLVWRASRSASPYHGTLHLTRTRSDGSSDAVTQVLAAVVPAPAGS